MEIKRFFQRVGCFICGSMLVASILTAQTSEAATRYVATSGSDSGSCGASRSPCRTLQQAFDQSGAGDTILIRSGTYAGFSAFNKGGSPGNPITIKPDTGAIVTLDRGLTPEHYPGYNPIIYLAGPGTGYITFDGNNGQENETLRFTDTAWSAPPQGTLWTPEGGTNVPLCEAWDRWAARYKAIEFQWISADLVEDHPRGITIRNTRFFNIRGNFIVGQTRDFLFENNHMYNDADRDQYHLTPYGFYIADGNNLIWRNNRIHGLYLGIRAGTGGHYPSNLTIENNLIYDNWGKGPWAAHTGCEASAGGNGIQIAYASQAIIRNNVVYGNRLPGNEGWGYPYASAWQVIGIAAGSNQVYNNTVAFHGGSYSGYSSPEGITLNSGGVARNNISYDNSIPITLNGGTASNNLMADPRFVSPTDLRLQAGSPAIDEGVAISEVPVDYDRIARPQGGGYDIGAYEYVLRGLLPPGNFRRIVSR